MERIYLIKRFGHEIGWEIDITDLPFDRIIEFIKDEIGLDDCQIKRTPARVVDECIENIKTKAIRGTEK